jgi:release factor glutamine methyltransferase
VTVAAALQAAQARLAATSESARFDARLLLEAACGRDGARLIAYPEHELDEAAAARYGGYLERRSAGEPVAYIIGSAGFYGRTFLVDPRVLIPRPESEHVVEAALDHLRSRRAGGAHALRAADVGTGSGALAITLAAELDGLQVAASDLSADALDVAAKNAAANGVAERVHFAQGDLLEPLAAHGPFDCIVANLPYIPSAEVPGRPNPAGYEPRLALDGGADGLDLYRRLLAAVAGSCALGAMLFFEAAPGTIQALAVLAERALPGAAVEVGADYAGLERYVSVEISHRSRA